MGRGKRVVVVASDVAERRALTRELLRFDVIEVEPARARAAIAEGCCAVIAEQRGGGAALLREMGESGPLRLMLVPSGSPAAGKGEPGVADTCLVQPWRRGQVASALTQLLHARRPRPVVREVSQLRDVPAMDAPDEPALAAPLPPRRATTEPTLADQLQATLALLRAQGPREVLGLEASADGRAARRAFLARSKAHHPDRYAQHEDAEVRRLATEIFVVYERALAAIRREGDG